MVAMSSWSTERTIGNHFYSTTHSLTGKLRRINIAVVHALNWIYQILWKCKKRPIYSTQNRVISGISNPETRKMGSFYGGFSAFKRFCQFIQHTFLPICVNFSTTFWLFSDYYYKFLPLIGNPETPKLLLTLTLLMYRVSKETFDTKCLVCMERAGKCKKVLFFVSMLFLLCTQQTIFLDYCLWRFENSRNSAAVAESLTMSCGITLRLVFMSYPIGVQRRFLQCLVHWSKAAQKWFKWIKNGEKE